MDKAYLNKWKEYTIILLLLLLLLLSFWPRIEKNDIIAIKVIGTALNKPNLPYIIFAILIWTLIGCPAFVFIFEYWLCFYLFDWIWNKFPYFRSQGYKTFTSITDCKISLPFKNWCVSKIVVFIGKLKQRIYNLRRDLVFSIINFSCKGL